MLTYSERLKEGHLFPVLVRNKISINRNKHINKTMNKLVGKREKG